MSSIKCPTCNLINFASAEFCKRCNNPLTNLSFSTEGNTYFNPSIPTSFKVAQPVPQNQDLGGFREPYRFQSESSAYENGYASQAQTANSYGYAWQQSNHPAQFAPAMPLPYQAQGVWRRGHELIMDKQATLPERCVKCNVPLAASRNGNYIVQKFSWHNPLLYIALISPIIYCILAAVLSERFSVNIPLCHEHTEERKNVKKFLIGGGLAALAAVVFFILFDAIGVTILIFLVALIGLSVAHEYLYKSLKVKKVENQYVHLQGACPDFLNSLPSC